MPPPPASQHSLLVFFVHNVENVYGDAVKSVGVDRGLHKRQEGADHSGRNYEAAEVVPEGGVGWAGVAEVLEDSARSLWAVKMNLTNRELWGVQLDSGRVSGFPQVR